MSVLIFLSCLLFPGQATGSPSSAMPSRLIFVNGDKYKGCVDTEIW